MTGLPAAADRVDPRVELSETGRLEAFSDGVFAIAITLLVLEIRVPHADALHPVPLGTALARLWPSYLGYVMSFLIIGIMWVNHHSIFRYIRRTDRAFLLINVVFLLCVSFLPFPTAVLAEHLTAPESRRTAALFYGATLFVIALAFNAVWRYGVAHGRLLGTGADRRGVAAISRLYLFGPLMYLGTTAVAFVSVGTSLALHAIFAVVFALPERRAGTAR